MLTRCSLALVAALLLEVLVPRTASAVTMDPAVVSFDNGQGGTYDIRLTTSSPGTGGELRFRFTECCAGGGPTITMVFDAPVQAVTNYSPGFSIDGFIADIGFSGSMVTVETVINFGTLLNWGVDFATFPTSAAISVAPGSVVQNVAFVPEPATGSLFMLGLTGLALARRST